MKLPNFAKTTKNENPAPPWMEEMDEGDFISCNTSYKSGGYLDWFEECVFPCREKGNVAYYVYNPVKHGAPADRRYPVLMWIHGLSCAVDGKKCVSYCGAEQYASPAYQESMGGGAFIIVPLANEKRLEDNTIIGSWDEAYIPVVKGIYDRVCAENEENIGSRFIMGASSGGYVTWRLLEDYPEYFDGGIPIASGYVPKAEGLKKIDDAGIRLIVGHGRHDEMADFEKCILPREQEIRALKNVVCFFPEWVRNGDRGVASVNYGVEMGQHCMINQFQENLIFDDKTCCDERLPEGVTGWIREVCAAGA